MTAGSPFASTSPSSTTGDMAVNTPSTTMYPTTAARAVEPSAFFAQPIAMPTAKMRGNQVKTAWPAAEITEAVVSSGAKRPRRSG